MRATEYAYFVILVFGGAGNPTAALSCHRLQADVRGHLALGRAILLLLLGLTLVALVLVGRDRLLAGPKWLVDAALGLLPGRRAP